MSAIRLTLTRLSYGERIISRRDRSPVYWCGNKRRKDYKTNRFAGGKCCPVGGNLRILIGLSINRYKKTIKQTGLPAANAVQWV